MEDSFDDHVYEQFKSTIALNTTALLELTYNDSIAMSYLLDKFVGKLK